MKSRLKEAWGRAQPYLRDLVQGRMGVLNIAVPPELPPISYRPSDEPLTMLLNMEVYEFTIRTFRDAYRQPEDAFCGRRRGEDRWVFLELLHAR